MACIAARVALHRDAMNLRRQVICSCAKAELFQAFLAKIEFVAHLFVALLRAEFGLQS